MGGYLPPPPSPPQPLSPVFAPPAKIKFSIFPFPNVFLRFSAGTLCFSAFCVLARRRHVVCVSCFIPRFLTAFFVLQSRENKDLRGSCPSQPQLRDTSYVHATRPIRIIGDKSQEREFSSCAKVTEKRSRPRVGGDFDRLRCALLQCA